MFRLVAFVEVFTGDPIKAFVGADSMRASAPKPSRSSTALPWLLATPGSP
jgi:hypothetical protein